MLLRRLDVSTQLAAAPKKSSNVDKQVQVTNGGVNVSDEKAGSKALSNYFRGSQMVNFAGHPCSKSEFKVKREEGIPCACCGRLMMTNDGVRNFETKADGAKGEDLQNLLSANMEFFRGTEKAVVNFILKTSKINPELTMQGIMTQYSPSARVLLEDEQRNVLSEVSKKASVLGKDNPVERYIQKGLKDIEKSNNVKHFERKPFLKGLVQVTNNLSDKELAGQILDSAVKLPMSQNSIEAFIVKYGHGTKTDKEIAHRLAQTAVATAEHIHPDTLGGPDHTSNYVAECGDCNSKRGHMPLEEWMENFPNMPRSVQRNIDEVTERIIQGNLGSRYDDYPIDVKATMNRETGGVIKLEVKNPEEIEKAREERGLPAPQESGSHH